MKNAEEIEILWLIEGLGCDGKNIALTNATQPNLEDILARAITNTYKDTGQGLKLMKH